MNKKKILNILNSYEWKEEESQLSFHILDHWKTSYLEGKNAYKKNLYSVCVYLFDNNYGYEWAPKDEARKTLAWTIKKYAENRTYLKKKYKEFVEVSLDINDIFFKIKRGLGEYNNNDLKKTLIKLFNLGKKQYGYSLLPEGLDTLSEQDYLGFLPEIKPDKALDIVRILSSPEELGFVYKERLALIKLAKKYFKYIKRASEDIKKHRENYFWIQNSFRGAVYLDDKFFFDSLKKIIKEKSLKGIKKEIYNLKNKNKLFKKEIRNIYKKYNISKKAKSFFELVRFFARLQDERKENVQKIVYSVDQIFNEINKRFKISKSKLDNYLIKEIIEVLEKGKKVSEKELNKRRKTVTFSYIENNKIKTDYLFNEEADSIINFFKEKRKEFHKKELKGFVASTGFGKNILIRGRARIVFNPTKDVFNKEEILVTGMTRPEFVPLMKKAKAIITNEGGITTHAAIISRELKTPCIIGTKVATDVIKNGDWVQLDLKRGVIKIIEK